MLKIIDGFKKLIRFIVSVFASREFAFIYCLIGTLTQITHTYYLAEIISSFSEGFKQFQAVLLSTFISSSLLYFVAIADGTESKENKKIMLAVNIFMIIEILINLYYYSRHLLIDSQELQIFDFIFAVLIACLIPVTLKLYASTIRAKEWFEEMTHNKENKNLDFSDEKYLKLITNTVQSYISKIEYSNDNKIIEFVDSYMKNKVSFNYDKIVEEIKPLIIDELKTETQGNDKILKDIDSEVAKIFEKNQKLFLSQFENKIKLLIEKSKDETRKLGPNNYPQNENKELEKFEAVNINKTVIEEALELSDKNKGLGIDSVVELEKRLKDETSEITKTFSEENIDNNINQ